LLTTYPKTGTVADRSRKPLTGAGFGSFTGVTQDKSISMATDRCKSVTDSTTRLLPLKLIKIPSRLFKLP
jgi:hypothetical protein